eukprot:5610537-Alexandrium_andersonii.AAC.1
MYSQRLPVPPGAPVAALAELLDGLVQSPPTKHDPEIHLMMHTAYLGQVGLRRRPRLAAPTKHCRD